MGCVGWVGCVGKVGRGGCVGCVGSVGGDVGGFGQLVVGVVVGGVLDGGDVAAPQIKDPPHFGKNQILFFSPIIFFDHLGEYEAVHFLSAQS